MKLPLIFSILCFTSVAMADVGGTHTPPSKDIVKTPEHNAANNAYHQALINNKPLPPKPAQPPKPTKP